MAIDTRPTPVALAHRTGESCSWSVIVQGAGYASAPTGLAKVGAVTVDVTTTADVAHDLVVAVISMTAAASTEVGDTFTTWSLYLSGGGGPSKTWVAGDFEQNLFTAESPDGATLSVVASDAAIYVQVVAGGNGGDGDVQTNLSYTAIPTGGIVASSTGNDASLSLADTSNAGLMAPAQYTKLAGVETGATADQTGAEILTALLPVDGPASGLDADTVDGQHAAAFATAATVAAAVTAAVNGLLDGAPGALDTLNELAAALNDDASFAATITTALAGKQPLDADLTAIAALTTTSFGRSLLEAASASALRTLGGLVIGTDVHAREPALDAWAGKTAPSGTVVGSTDGQTLTNKTITAPILQLEQLTTPAPTQEGRIIWDSDDNRITIGDGAGTRVFSSDAVNAATYQPIDSDLTAIAALSTTSFGRAVLALADAAALRTAAGTVIGTDVQGFDADLSAIAGLTSAADKGIQFTGAGTAATYDLTTAGKALLDDADNTAQRATLGLGTIATQAASAVAITGGSVAGITDITVTDGGTGASTAVAARTNLSVQRLHMVDVRDPNYGAVADGSTDDRAAIQAALNTGAAVVLLPAGVYFVDIHETTSAVGNSLTPSAGQRIVGQPGTVIRWASAAPYFPVFWIYQKSNITIEGIDFQNTGDFIDVDAQATKNGTAKLYLHSACSCIAAVEVAGLTIRDCKSYGQTTADTYNCFLYFTEVTKLAVEDIVCDDHCTAFLSGSGSQGFIRNIRIGRQSVKSNLNYGPGHGFYLFTDSISIDGVWDSGELLTHAGVSSLEDGHTVKIKTGGATDRTLVTVSNVNSKRAAGMLDVFGLRNATFANLHYDYTTGAHPGLATDTAIVGLRSGTPEVAAQYVRVSNVTVRIAAGDITLLKVIAFNCDIVGVDLTQSPSAANYTLPAIYLRGSNNRLTGMVHRNPNYATNKNPVIEIDGASFDNVIEINQAAGNNDYAPKILFSNSTADGPPARNTMRIAGHTLQHDGWDFRNLTMNNSTVLNDVLLNDWLVNDRVSIIRGDTITATSISTAWRCAARFGTYLVNVGLRNDDGNHGIWGLWRVHFDDRSVNDFTVCEQIGTFATKGSVGSVVPTTYTLTVGNTGFLTLAGTRSSATAIRVVWHAVPVGVFAGT